MSFSVEVKEELAALRNEKSCCALSELNALTQFCASVTLQSHRQLSMIYTTENVSTAKRIFILLKKRMEITAIPHYSKLARFGGRQIYRLNLSPNDTRRLMYALHMLYNDANGESFRGIPRRALTRKCCQQAFLRGAFLSAGSIAAPERCDHAEFVCPTAARAQSIQNLLKRTGLPYGVTQRREASVVYLKRGAAIATLLGQMGATRALMRYENVLARRNLAESVRRVTNCDYNNIKRLLAAVQRQMAAIQLLQDRGVMDLLPPALREIALLRLQNPDASSEQLGKMLPNPLGKSGVNHRLRRLLQYAETLKEPPQ